MLCNNGRPAGVDGLLPDKIRPPGKAPVFPGRVAEVVRLTLKPPPPAATHWTAQAMARAVGLVISTVQKGLECLQPPPAFAPRSTAPRSAKNVSGRVSSKQFGSGMAVDASPPPSRSR